MLAVPRQTSGSASLFLHLEEGHGHRHPVTAETAPQVHPHRPDYALLRPTHTLHLAENHASLPINLLI